MFCITSHKCEDLPYLKHKSGIPGTNLILLSTTHLKEDYIFCKDGVSFSKSSLCWLLLIAEQAILRGTTAFSNQPWRKEAHPFPKSCAQLREKPKRNSSAHFPVWSEILGDLWNVANNSLPFSTEFHQIVEGTWTVSISQQWRRGKKVSTTQSSGVCTHKKPCFPEISIHQRSNIQPKFLILIWSMSPNPCHTSQIWSSNQFK